MQRTCVTCVTHASHASHMRRARESPGAAVGLTERLRSQKERCKKMSASMCVESSEVTRQPLVLRSIDSLGFCHSFLPISAKQPRSQARKPPAAERTSCRPRAQVATIVVCCLEACRRVLGNGQLDKDTMSNLLLRRGTFQEKVVPNSWKNILKK